MSKEKQILQLRTKGYSQRRIADTLKVSRNTVAKVFKASEEHSVSEDSLNILNDLELHQLLFPEESQVPVLVAPNYDYLHKELLKSGVTLKLLWEEYVDACRRSGKPPYMYSQFCKLYQEYVNQHRLTMHIRHKPGDKLMVDWVGTPLPLYDKVTGKSCKVYLFVATLPFSMYCFAKACLTLKEEDWINVHISMYEYFGASTRLLIPDNLKTGILSNKKYEDPIVNRAYQELADHYQTALLPARVATPKDKAAVEGTAGQVTSHIIAKLRNRQFFDISKMNAAISKELERLNHNEFQKREGSRYSVFMEEELPFMQPLPLYPYEFAQWKTATVQLNYHIGLDYQNYSTPYEYVKKKVDVRYTKNMIEVFYKGSRICSHKRLYGRRGQYSTVVDHMPPNHQLYSEWDSARFLKWATDIGDSTKDVVQKLFDSYRVEEQAYKGCLSLLKLADKYSPERLENACRIALIRIPNPRYKNIRLILESGQDKKDERASQSHSIPSISNKYAYVRGAAYYGGGNHEE
jgi:transposase